MAHNPIRCKLTNTSRQKLQDTDLTGNIGLLLQLIEDEILFGSAAIEFLTRNLRFTMDAQSHLAPNRSLDAYLGRLQEDCNFYKLYMSRCKDWNERFHVETGNKLSTRQANSVSQLTMLAAIFLPLSLSAAVLSMQTRFADLHLLLYDFLGVIVILGTVALLVAGVNRWGIVAYDKFIGFSYGWRLWSEETISKVIKLIFFVLWWASFLASFLIGMLKDEIVGLETLGYAAAGICFVWIVSLPVVRWFYDGYYL